MSSGGWPSAPSLRNRFSCPNGLRNKMYVDLAISSSWTFYDLPFSTFIDKYPACSFIGGGWLTQVSALVFIKTALGSGSVDLDLVEYYF